MGTLSLPVRLALPGDARAGSVVSLRLLLQHPMETGYRIGEDGARIPRHILTTLRVSYGNREIAALTLRPAIAANPYFALSFIADQTGPVTLEVEDDRGAKLTESRMLTVVP